MSELRETAPRRHVAQPRLWSLAAPVPDGTRGRHLVALPPLVDDERDAPAQAPVDLTTAQPGSVSRAQVVGKRVFDVAGSAALIAVLSPLLLLIALVIKINSPGPVLFRQTRVGLNGSTFSMLKFRSMVVDAESLLVALAELQRREGNHIMFKMRDDPRVTALGRFMRRFSIDELPQLFNVFAGSMSLVGPRPPLEREVALYEGHVHRRFDVKPGITGLWQVSGRSNLSWDDTVRLDLHYVENWSFGGDFVILLRTFRAVLVREGAF